MKEVSLLFEELVSDIDKSIKIDSFDFISGDTHFFTCNTKWARKGKKILVKVDEATTLSLLIKDIVKDVKIVVKNYHTPLSVSLPNPFEVSGTKTSTNNEWNLSDSNLLNKTPIIWLYSNYREVVYGDGASLERAITMNIAFLDETNILYQKNKEHIDNVVVPMKELVESFMESINKKAIYKKLNQFTLNTYSRFGVETDTGVIQNILDANLGGVVLNVTLEKFKEPCKC